MKTNKITNPIIPGFNPDPAMCKVGDTYYIATSTFNSFPGVAIYSSKNLINWDLIDTPLNTDELLNLKGSEPRFGIYAPDLTYANGRFYLLSVNVQRDDVKACVSYSKKIGEWTKPIYITNKGIDQAFYHESDKSYVLTVEWNDEKHVDVNIQEWDNVSNELIGSVKTLWQGKQELYTEAPHLYKSNGYYYLTVAEGGTRFGHRNTILRSKEMFGEYEESPYGPLITAINNPENPIQKAGHASLVIEGKDIWVAHLGSRPFNGVTKGGSALGRETFIQRYKFTDDGWMENVDGGNIPRTIVESVYEGEEQTLPQQDYDFTNLKTLPIEFLSVREQITDKWLNLSSEGLVLKGRKDMTSLDTQSTINLRWLCSNFNTSTEILANEADGVEYGINHRYDEFNQILFFVKKEGNKKTINLKVLQKGEETISESFEIRFSECIKLLSFVGDGVLKFAFELDGSHETVMSNNIDISVLFEESAKSSFTGTLFGIFAVDQKQTAKVIFRNLKVEYKNKWSIN